jgi:hypothetical protein
LVGWASMLTTIAVWVSTEGCQGFDS